jgi:DNA-binding CsgD family transcriptional regulator
MLRGIFYELLETSNRVERDIAGSDVFEKISSRLGVRNVAYMGINLPRKTNREFYVHNTYSKAWAKQYETANYVSIDPILRLGMTSLMPIDWGDVGKLTKAQMDFFADAQGYGVGQNGLSFPIRGVYNETAVFSVTAELSKREWQNFKREKLRELRAIADMIHQSVIGDEPIANPSQTEILTEREVECLRWSAEGKTYQDIADVLGLSSRTIKFFLENARNKLRCVNTTQSVVVALQRGII